MAQPFVVPCVMVCAGDGSGNGDGDSESCENDDDCEDEQKCKDKKCEGGGQGPSIAAVCSHLKLVG